MSSWTNISDALTDQARTQPDRPALIVPTRRVGGQWRDRRYSYRELEHEVQRLAAGLIVHDIEPGTRVALMVPPSLEFFA
ncbi:MAG: AMP-binding protein, partial [Wenzhouxiangellaceae bacterium]|nr:AMP-binding protein [Wenzhouxiangellaceae bacterium]